MKRIAIFMIRCYQWTFGLLLPRSCRFYPTCSNYAIEAISTHGIIKGILLSAWRILRCNPWSLGGYDPVPMPDRSASRNTGERWSAHE